MSSDLVIDASAVVKAFLPEIHSDEVIALLAKTRADPPVRLFAPDLIFAECANIFWMAVRRNRMTPQTAETSYSDLAALPILRIPTPDVAGEALRISLATGVSGYDACYVAVAARYGIPLVTADDRLLAKLRGGPVEVRGLREAG